MYKSLFPELERGRSSGNDDTTAGGLVATQRLCIIFLTYKKIYRDSHHCSRQHRQRKELAQQAAVPPFTIATDAQLAEMAKIKEPSLAKLGSIEGIGEARLKSYGEAFLSILVESVS